MRLGSGVTPLLVTGMPRSGTTWLARLLSEAEGCALTGREPMNPRGRQFALGGTLKGWARLENPTRLQRVALRASYRGLNPLVFSRYGHRQWAAPIPGVRNIVKDPFAMLSIPVVRELTGARCVLLFRHPGAALASYRRMGWRPDVAELAPIVERFTSVRGPVVGVDCPPPGATKDDVGVMAWFWSALYGMALDDVEQHGGVMVLGHHDVAAGGQAFSRALFPALGLSWGPRVDDHLARQESVTSTVDSQALHNFHRPPSHVAQAWEEDVSARERQQLEQETEPVFSRLQEVAFTPPERTD